jgi:hypothetical protein
MALADVLRALGLDLGLIRFRRRPTKGGYDGAHGRRKEESETAA